MTEEAVVIEEKNIVKAKLEVVKGGREPKTVITVSIALPYDKKEEISQAVIDVCESLWEKYRSQLM